MRVTLYQALQNRLSHLNTCLNNAALVQAASNGQVKVVKESLKDKRIDVNVQNRYGDTALTLAPGYGDIEEIVRFLGNDYSNKYGSCLQNQEIFRELENVLNKAASHERELYKNFLSRLKNQKLDNSMLKFTIGYCTLLQVEASTKQLRLWNETFSYLESNELPTSEYTSSFISLVEHKGKISYKELKLYACSAVSLIEEGKSIEGLTKKVLDSLEMSNITKIERKALIVADTSDVTKCIDKIYETKVDRIKTKVKEALKKITIEIPLILFRMMVGV